MKMKAGCLQILWGFLAGVIFTSLMSAAASSHAAVTIASATLNGATTLNVTPGATISVTITVSHSNNGDDWFSTGWLITDGQGNQVSDCQDTPNHSGRGTFTETFNITAPSTESTYTVYFGVYDTRGTCRNQDLQDTYTMANALRVIAYPSVSSISLASANPTNPSTNVSWTVVFDKSVTGVDQADFSLVTGGNVTGASITSVSGGGTTWTVTAKTGSGDGTLGLNLVDDDSIVANGARLGGTGAGNGNYSGPAYTIPAPAVVSMNLASADPTSSATTVSWTVVFNRSVTGVDKADFALVPGGGVTGASITSVTGSGTTWTVSANTGSGSGSLGLNLVDDDTIVDVSGTKLGGAGAGNGNFTGAAYTIKPPFCSPPANAPAGVTLTCVCDTFSRSNLNPSTIYGANWIVSTSDTTGIVPSIVNPGYLRLTNNTTNNAKAVTVPGIFPAAGNYISVEFQHYAYGSNTNPGADGIAVTLSDYLVPPVPGAFGGSLGYAQKTPPAVTANIPGFAGGWIGVALDEYGNFQSATEGRIGGQGTIAQSVGVRGSGSGVSGYNWLAGTNGLNPGIDNRTSTTPSRGYYYQVIVDARNPTSAAVSVNRDTGAGYTSLISIPNVYTAAANRGFTQAPVPENWQISFTGSTGGSTNIHEIGGLRICAQTVVPPSGGTASGFSVIDEGYGTPALAVQNYLTGHIYTKLVGTAFKLNVAALSNSQIQTIYAAGANKSVTVKLVDNSDGKCVLDSTQANYCNSACISKTAVSSGSQTLTFTASDKGQKQSANFTLNSAYRNLVAIVDDGTTAACSIDAFSVRPTGITSVTSSDATNLGTSGGRTFKAGADKFSLTATVAGVAGSSSGYDGVLKINKDLIQALSPATVAGTVSPLSFPAATKGTGSSTALGDKTFTYSEVGAFVLPPYSVFDGVVTTSECQGKTTAQCDTLKAATWTGVDSISGKGDCVADSFSNAKDASGKYGCNFGNSSTSATATLGRFIPYRFALSSTLTNRADLSSCPDSFTYFGEQLNAKFTLTAQAADGSTTRNYTGDLAKLDPTVFANLRMAAADRTTSLPAPASAPPYRLTPTADGMPAIKCGTTPCFQAGVAADIDVAFKFARNASPEGAYGAVDIGINPMDEDGVTVPLDIDTTSTTNTPSALVFDHGMLGTTELRYGRLRIDNAYGSELLKLSVPVTADYWNGKAYARNTLDNCSPLAGSNFELLNHTGGLDASNMNASNIAGGLALSGGSGKIVLNAPSPRPTKNGSVDLRSNSANLPYLPGIGRETFGVYKAGRVIYVREIY
ncbi:DUF6701 domain-containing protein [Noviherbaspirillum massiliense]|uniref:DUF6701 domain-containing protein n=1 Tax=Noviherbaspirillum massiliense TaxID=1465823 RepID=UPI00031510A3|nr:DUF6701 domain-containing protein [Noviherbaspirillum massiliense]